MGLPRQRKCPQTGCEPLDWVWTLRLSVNPQAWCEPSDRMWTLRPGVNPQTEYEPLNGVWTLRPGVNAQCEPVSQPSPKWESKRIFKFQQRIQHHQNPWTCTLSGGTGARYLLPRRNGDDDDDNGTFCHAGGIVVLARLSYFHRFCSTRRARYTGWYLTALIIHVAGDNVTLRVNGYVLGIDSLEGSVISGPMIAFFFEPPLALKCEPSPVGFSSENACFPGK